MKGTASIAQLKARLSEYLRQVKAGGELVVTERGVPVARIVPLNSVERRATRRLRLLRTGVIRSGKGRVRKELLSPPTGEPVGRQVLAALLSERASDRER
jgi:prevent-host-death family protein